MYCSMWAYYPSRNKKKSTVGSQEDPLCCHIIQTYKVQIPKILYTRRRRRLPTYCSHVCWLQKIYICGGFSRQTARYCVLLIQHPTFLFRNVWIITPFVPTYLYLSNKKNREKYFENLCFFGYSVELTRFPSDKKLFLKKQCFSPAAITTTTRFRVKSDAASKSPVIIPPKYNATRTRCHNVCLGKRGVVDNCHFP